MRRADIIGGIITILLGIFAITQSAQLDYWSTFGPGPGFVPLWSSLIIIFGGILLIIQALRMRPMPVKAMDKQKIKRYGVVVLVAGLSVAAAVLMDIIGFTLSMFLFMATMMGFSRKHKWPVVVATAVTVAVSFYFVFDKWLQVPLPKGFIGF